MNHIQSVAGLIHTFAINHGYNYEDAVQDAYVGYFEAKQRHDPFKSKLVTYAYRRMKGNLINRNMSPESYIDEFPTIKDRTYATQFEFNQLIHDICVILDTHYWQRVFFGKALEGHSSGTIAKEFGVSRQAVEQIYAKCLKKLRAEL